MVRAGGQPGTIQIPWPTPEYASEGGGEDEGWVVQGTPRLRTRGGVPRRKVFRAVVGAALRRSGAQKGRPRLG